MTVRKQPEKQAMPLGERRLLEVAAAIARQPGIKAVELAALFARGEASELAADVRAGRATIAACVSRLKAFGILEDRAHRSGYFLAGLGLSDRELAFAINGLEIQAEHLGCAVAATTRDAILDRLLRGRLKSDPEIAYPTVAVVARVLPKPVPAFHELMDVLWDAIRGGIAVEVPKVAFPWGLEGPRSFRIWPLQFQFHDRAWYILCEDLDDQERDFKVLRIDRLGNVAKGLDIPARSNVEQARALAAGRSRQARGWALVVPSRSSLDRPVQVTILLDAWAAGFFDDSRHEPRHPTQHTAPTGDGGRVFQIALPDDPWVIEEFRRWVVSWGPHARVIEPASLVERVVADLGRTLEVYDETGRTSPGMASAAPGTA